MLPANRGPEPSGVVKTITAIYRRPQYTMGGAWLFDRQVEVDAECEQLGDDVVVIYTDETLAKLAELNFDGEELLGVEECLAEAFWASEREACRLASIKQRAGAEVAA